MEQRGPGRPQGTGQPRVFTNEELAKFKQQLEKECSKWSLLYALTFWYAMRMVEIAELRMSDFNPHTNEVTIRGRRAGCTRVYGIPERLRMKLNRYLRDRGKTSNPFLFPGCHYPETQHISISSIEQNFQRILRAAGVDGPHSVEDLRHTQARSLAESGDTLLQITSWLRLREPASAQRYLNHRVSIRDHNELMNQRGNAEF